MGKEKWQGESGKLYTTEHTLRQERGHADTRQSRKGFVLIVLGDLYHSPQK